MGAGGEKMFGKIFLVGFGADDALAAALLGTVFSDRGAFNKAKVRKGDDSALVGDHVVHAQFPGIIDNLGAARRGVFIAQLEQFFFD